MTPSTGVDRDVSRMREVVLKWVDVLKYSLLVVAVTGVDVYT